MSAREFFEWSAFERVAGPILVHERIDYAAANICWVVASALGDGKRKYKPEDFLVRWGAADSADRPAQTPADMIAVLRSLQKRRKEQST